MYGDDEKNAVTHNVLALHLGGVDSLSRQSGIHGHHLDQYEYVATDSTYQNIIAVTKHNPDGTTTQFVSTDWKGPVKGVTRQMDCMDCHQQATHTFQTAEDAIDEAMTVGSPNPALPYVHKKGLELVSRQTTSRRTTRHRRLRQGCRASTSRPIRRSGTDSAAPSMPRHRALWPSTSAMCSRI